jgi:hypothetical protein
MPKQILQAQIDEQTRIIREEESRPYSPVNADPKREAQRRTMLRDAYWRRRMLVAQRDGLTSPHAIG